MTKQLPIAGVPDRQLVRLANGHEKEKRELQAL
jgi:hypothetical protein